VLGVAAAQAAEPDSQIPVADFARSPAFSQLQISLGGSRIGFVREERGQQRLFVAPVDQLDRPHEIRIDRAGDRHPSREVASFTWSSDERLVVGTGVSNATIYGVLALDGDGRRRVGLSGHELEERDGPRFFGTKSLYAFEDPGPSILMANNRTRDGTALLYPDILRVDTRDASRALV